MDSATSNRPRFDGWKTLVGVMLAYGSICGNMTYAYGVFLPAMGETFQWSRSALSGPYAVYILISGEDLDRAGDFGSRFRRRRRLPRTGGEDRLKIAKLILTASGGPFLSRLKEEFSSITVEHALNHPNWKMGKKSPSILPP
jgi:hypothetical protein